jgi:hypothetical protein
VQRAAAKLPSVPPKNATPPPSFSRTARSPGTTRVDDLVTRPMDVDPSLLAESRDRSAAAARRGYLHGVWQGVKFVATGFLIGAVAVHAVAIMRMTRRIDALHARIDQMSLEQERSAASKGARAGEPAARPSPVQAAPAPPSKREPRGPAPASAPMAAPSTAPGSGLVFPALEIRHDGARSGGEISARD